MNIFVVDKNPVKAARMLCDQHVVRMPLETAMMLCCAFPAERAPYRRTHFNHPCTKWVRKSRGNFLWTVRHGMALCEEFHYRYGKVHKSCSVINWCFDHMHELQFEKQKRTPFALAIDKQYEVPGDAVLSYRRYYVFVKSRFARWEKNRPAPEWYRQALAAKVD